MANDLPEIARDRVTTANMKCVLCTLLVGVFCVSLAGKSKPPESIPDSPAGFSQQYQPLFSAWMNNDDRKLDRLLDEFAIPKSWFSEMFGDEQGPELAKMYEEQFEDFKLHISRSFRLAKVVGVSYVQKRYGRVSAQMLLQTTLATTVEPKPAPKPTPESLQPLPAVQRFTTDGRVRVRDEEKTLTSWMDSFVYIDGKFRFLGRGAYPFWDAARVRLADPCAKPGEQTGGKLTRKVEPEYPQAAKELRIQGTVKARLTIGTDGAVEAVEITGGPPELAEAARKAFQQWQYTAFMNCGKAVEMRSMEHISFSLP